MKTPARIAALCLLLSAGALLTSFSAALADEYDALRADAEMHEGLIIVAIADRIRDNCPNFSARPVRGLAFLEGLVGRARSLGYSRSEVEAFVDDDAEEARYLALADQWFAQQGADVTDAESVCEQARSEIAAGSTIGRLLREG